MVPTKTAAQRRRPTQDRAKATREHILDTAARLFGERGIAGTSTNRIAAEAGVSIGTVYRYFADRSVLVEELLARLLESVEKRFTQRMFDLSGKGPTEVWVDILTVITDELVARAALVRALVAGVQFYSSGIPEFEPRLRLLVKVMLIQLLGPGDDHRYDVMTFVLINTGFAAALRSSALEVESTARREAIDMTGRMIGAFLESESDAVGQK
ncbi:TetR/AcrR family transcriptional regulator [Nocardia asteroides]|uniref:TetR/AcrR family transcriptional regulator n=1 Tax=Nocardia asteroides TaxID=1824 RepID=UPI001E4AC654|nr:TetR/AcrR family transcriptional regulator [Nocardia asteroides]UGT63034.1 TetR/AcrR family transcriptional regulator [Nocardia asteroides]